MGKPPLPALQIKLSRPALLHSSHSICGFFHASPIEQLTTSANSKCFLSAPSLRSKVSVVNDSIYKTNKFIVLVPPFHTTPSKCLEHFAIFPPCCPAPSHYVITRKNVTCSRLPQSKVWDSMSTPYQQKTTAPHRTSQSNCSILPTHCE